MPPSNRFDSIIQYTTIAASTLKVVADAARMPILSAPTAQTVAILKIIEGFKSNKDEATQIMEEIHQVLCCILSLHSATQRDGILPPAILYDIAKFTDTLQKIGGVLRAQQNMGRLKQLLKQHGNTSQLQACRKELQNSVESFRDQCLHSNLIGIAQMQMDAKGMHDELMALLLNNPDLTNSDTSSLAPNSLWGMSESSASFTMLPSHPQIFHGRETELEHIVDILKQDTARIAILGGGGMGKTTLATAALHHPDVEDKYSQRYFVPCHTMTNSADIVSAIASHIGLDKGSSLKQVLRCLEYSSVSLLVLDNFETPWEFKDSRKKVEDLLAHLADISSLAILITMRGAERPGNIQWSRPFLPALGPITDSAALKTFVDIADADHEKASVAALLELTGNLPLAVTLISSAVANEGCDEILARWKVEKTRVLSDGYDKRSSLEISIMLSLSSPRMTTNALELLSLLSILPDGLSEAELAQCNLPISNAFACKATLLRTSLATVDNNRRLKLLVPIREYVYSSNPPTDILKVPVRNYLHSLLHLWKSFENMQLSPNVISQIVSNLGNLNSLLLDGLQADSCTITVLQSAFDLYDFTQETNRPIPSLIYLAMEHIEAWRDHPVYGQFLITILRRSSNFPMLDVEAHISAGNEYFAGASPIDKARWYASVGAHYQVHDNNLAKALEHCFQALALVDGMNQPTKVGWRILVSIVDDLVMADNPAKAKIYAERGYVCAQQLGHAIGEAISVSQRGRCAMAMGDFQHATRYMQNALSLFEGSELQGTQRHIKAQSYLAELHMLKTEYAESRTILEASMANIDLRHGPTLNSIFSDLNKVSIDIAVGANLDMVQKTLETLREQMSTFVAPVAFLFHDMIVADLKLHQGDLACARGMFARTSLAFLGTVNEGATFCLERLADPGYGMDDTQGSLRWSAVLLGLARKIKDNLAQAQAIRCLGKVFLAEGDHNTAFSLFQLALEELTFMDVHRWRADCMMHLAQIHELRGNIKQSVALWRTARPLFERTAQKKDVLQIAAKLATVADEE